MPAFELPKRHRRQKNTDTKPIPYKETLDLLNEFYISTLHSLTEFSNSCEKKLNNVTFRIQKLEISCELIERKLKSIEGLNLDQLTDTKKVESVQVSANAPPPPGAPNAVPPPPPPGILPPGIDNSAGVGLPPPPPVANIMKTQDDPRLAQFFKYLRIGIKKENFASKMEELGYNPDWLDTPDAPTPLGEYTEAVDTFEVNRSVDSSDSDDSDF